MIKRNWTDVLALSMFLGLLELIIILSLVALINTPLIHVHQSRVVAQM